MLKLNFGKIKKYLSTHLKGTVYSTVLIIHIIVFIAATVRFRQPEIIRADVFELFDFKQEAPEDNPNKINKQKQEYTEAEKIIIKKEEQQEEENKKKDAFEMEGEGAYSPQHLLTKLPGMPEDLIKARMQYPPLAAKQGIEGVVILELLIDQNGNIKKITVLKDPGFGFAEKAIQALEGVKCTPAIIGDKAVPARFRYPIRFILQK